MKYFKGAAAIGALAFASFLLVGTAEPTIWRRAPR